MAIRLKVVIVIILIVFSVTLSSFITIIPETINIHVEVMENKSHETWI